MLQHQCNSGGSVHWRPYRDEQWENPNKMTDCEKTAGRITRLADEDKKFLEFEMLSFQPWQWTQRWSPSWLSDLPVTDWTWIVNLPFRLISRRKETHFCRLLDALGHSWRNSKIAPSASWEKKMSDPKMDFYQFLEIILVVSLMIRSFGINNKPKQRHWSETMSVCGAEGGGNERCVCKQWARKRVLLVVACGCLFSRAKVIYWRRCLSCRRVYAVPVQRHSSWTLTKTSWGGFLWPLPGKITGSDPNQGHWELPGLKLDHVQVRNTLTASL